jgi:hypothetical protein
MEIPSCAGKTERTDFSGKATIRACPRQWGFALGFERFRKDDRSGQIVGGQLRCRSTRFTRSRQAHENLKQQVAFVL